MVGAILGVILAALAACQTVGFYAQAISGQLEIQRKGRPIAQVLDDPTLNAELRRKLVLVQEIRSFAFQHLALPGNKSYGRYADIGRKHVVWNLFAAPEFSLEPKSWKYPFIGKLDYRGYFSEAAAEETAASLRRRGYEVMVGGVDAYSTLGWFHDPVLNTFVSYPDVALAELVFHELTHRRIFRRGDTVFNENLANAVAEEGVVRWLAHRGNVEALAHYRMLLERRRDFYTEVDRVRQYLETLYSSGLPPEILRQRKKIALGDLQNRLRVLRKRWGGRGLETWLKDDLTNAHLVAVTTYHHHIPMFKQLLEEVEGDMESFFERAEKLELPEP